MSDERIDPVRLVRGDTVPMEAVRWLWNGFLPEGMLTILGGAPGCGKTTIALSFAATITTGSNWPDGSRCTEPGDVLVWSGEDVRSVLAARLRAAGADMSRVYFVDRLEDSAHGAFDPGRDMLLLEATAEGLQNVRLLILDPIVSAVSGDAHRANDVRRALQPVVDLAQRIGCAVLGITHLTKGTIGREPTERITGSLAFGALARMVLIAAKAKSDGDDAPERRHVLVRAKSNIGPDEGGFTYMLNRLEVAPGVEGQRVLWLDAFADSARNVLAEAELDDDNDSRSDMEGFIRGCLADGPIPARTFKADAEGAGYQWRTIARAATRMGAESRKDGMRGGWRWGLSSGMKATSDTEDAKGVKD